MGTVVVPNPNKVSKTIIMVVVSITGWLPLVLGKPLAHTKAMAPRIPAQNIMC